MSRYIDADEALRMMRNSQQDNPCETPYKGIWNNAHECCISCVDAVPTTDVVEVVRCKECKYYNEYGEDPINGRRWGECHRPLGEDGCCKEVAENDYCSYGERSEE